METSILPSKLIIRNLQKFHSFFNRNLITPLLILILVGIFSLEIFLAQEFPHLFVAKKSLDVGLILAPFSHGNIVHLGGNIGMLLLFMWPAESLLNRAGFTLFVVFVAYVSTFSEVIVSTSITSTSGTLGISGVAYAFVPLFAIIGLGRYRAETPSFAQSTIVTAAVSVAILIPFDIMGLLPLTLVSGNNPAIYTHLSGFLLGISYGVFRLFD